MLLKYKQLFAWTPTDMPGITTTTGHKLGIYPRTKLVARKKRRFNRENQEFMKEEVQKLLNKSHVVVQIINKVKCLTRCLSNLKW